MIVGIIVTLLALMVVGTSLFLNLAPQFGAKKKAIRTNEVFKSPNYQDGTFSNREKTVTMTEFEFSTIPKFFTNGDKVPNGPVPVEKIQAGQIGQLEDSAARITWFGHSTILLETAGKTILIDPMLGNVPSPVAWAGSGRFNPELPIDAEALPFIDVVLITHDHYDHLDYGSILKLKDKVGAFYTPLGVDAHLRAWGVDPEKIIVMDWWDIETLEGLTFVSTPARHFSGRGMFDRDCTLWCSWVIKTDHVNIFFSGDGGYGEHFREIGNKFGPFDFAMMECGQYNKQWANIHMLPDEIPQALSDLKSKTFMPIHWGAFKLALHPWTEPIERVNNSIQGTELVIATPKIGEQFIIGRDVPKTTWWDLN